MQLLTILQLSVHEILEIYKTRSRQYFAFSMGLTIWGILGIVTITALIWGGYSATLPVGLSSDELWTINTFFNPTLMEMVNGLFVLVFAAYGIFLLHHRTNPEPPKWNDFFRLISQENGRELIVFALIQILIILIFDYWGRSREAAYNSSALNTLLYNMSGPNGSLSDWFFSVLMEVKKLVPYTLGFMLIRNHLRRSKLLNTETSLKAAYLGFILLCIVINLLFSVLLSYFSIYILTPISLQMSTAAVGISLVIIFTVFFIAQLATGHAAAFYTVFQPAPENDPDWEMRELKDIEPPVL